MASKNAVARRVQDVMVLWWKWVRGGETGRRTHSPPLDTTDDAVQYRTGVVVVVIIRLLLLKHNNDNINNNCY